MRSLLENLNQRFLALNAGPLGARYLFSRTRVLLSGEGARQGYLAAVDQGLISFSNFAATLLLARAVSPTELGIYGVGFTALRLVRAVQEGLTIQPVNAFGAGMEREAFARYATAVGWLQLGLASLSALAAAVGGLALTSLGNDTAGPALFALWFVFLFWQLQEFVRRLLYARGLVLQASVNTVIASAVRLGLLLYWAGGGLLSGVAGLDAIAWGSLAALLVGVYQGRSFWSSRWDSLLAVLKHNGKFGLWIMGGTIANWISVEFYPVLTAGMLSFAAAGAYRAIQNLVAPVHLLLRAVDTFLTPRAAREYTLRGRAALSRTLRLTYLLAGAPILGLLALAVLFPKPLLQLMYGETYLEYSSGVFWMALFYALWFAYWPLQTVLKASGVSRPIFFANILAAVAMFTVGIWMIARWGVYGTMGGQALNALVVCITLIYAWRQRKADRPQ